MSLSKKILISLLILALAVILSVSAFAEDGMIRVKLTRLGSPEAISFTSDCAYYVNYDPSAKISANTPSTITLSGGKLILTSGSVSKSLGTSFTLSKKTAGTNGVRFTTPAMANVFTGDFTFSISGKSIQTIMTIYVEDYLYGVVGYEMSNSYPLEALKAQAISARNYALRCKATRKSREYDLVDTSSDQVFKGFNSSYSRVIKAIDETRGKALYYEDSLASCYYGASNGGQTESTKNAWGSNLKYSVVKDDRYDLESGATSRAVSIHKDQTGRTMNLDLEAALIAGMDKTLTKYNLSSEIGDVTINKITSIETIEPKYPEPSRLFTKLRFTLEVTTYDENNEEVTGTAKSDVLTYGGIETWFDLSINSGSNETVWVDETDDMFTITFRRWGHGIGMSQRGAKVMADNYNMDVVSILDFYYPGTVLKTLNLKDTTGEKYKDDNWGEPIYRAEVTSVNSSGTINMKSEMSSSSSVVVKLPKGSVVDVYAENGTWRKVIYLNYKGYVKQKFLTPISTPTPSPSVSPTPEPTVEPTPTPTPEPEYQYARITLNSASSRLKIRKKPSTSSKVLQLIKHGRYVRVHSVTGLWANIETSKGVKGYVYKKYLTYVDLELAAEFMEEYGGESSHVYADELISKEKSVSAKATVNAVMYTKSNVKSTPVASVPKGANVTVLAYSDKWAYIDYGGKTGYVKTDCLGKGN